VADIVIDGSIAVATFRAFRSLVWKDADTGYQFFVDADGSFRYVKTTDGGATWGAPQLIGLASTHVAFDVWYDQWTPGDAGNIIHTTYFDTTSDDVFYRSFDVSSDTLGTQRTAFSGSSAVSDIGAHCSITKSVGGNLYISFDLDNGDEVGFSRSTDGVTWASRTAAVEAADDWSLLLPAANTGDTNDILALYQDASTDEFTLKWYDDSANTWTESSSMATVVENTVSGTGQYPFAASIRHSDGKLICAVVTERDTATSDHRVFELNRTAGAFSLTELTAITTNIDDHYHPAVFIDQDSDDIYVAYSGKRDGSETLGTALTSEVYYTKSTDDGTTWSAGDTAYSESTNVNSTTQIWTPLMGERFSVSYRRDTDTLETNKVNSIDFSGTGTEALLGSASTGSPGTAAPVLSVAL
jgi:hypothetical protein